MESSSPARASRLAARVLVVLALGGLGAALADTVDAADSRPARVDSSRPTNLGAALEEQIANDGSAVVLIHMRPQRLDGSLSGPGDGATEFRQQIARVQDRVLEILERDPDSRVRYRYEHVPGLLVEVDDYSLLQTVAGLAEVASVHADVRGSGALVESLSYIRADEAYQLGVDGSGSTVVVLDSGIEFDHPALEDARIPEFERHFLDRGDDTGTNALDRDGHGTHVAGILVSRGTADGQVPAGVAPGARVISIKVLDDDGNGWVSDWTRGVEEVIRLQRTEGAPRIDAVNMSLVVRTDYESVAECEAVNGAGAFVDACREVLRGGATLVGAAGNRGAENALTLPACFSSVISVGSVGDGSTDVFDSEADDVSSFTNRGDMLDLLAPGEIITSTGLVGRDLVSVKSGTSQACPHAAGVVCLMKQGNPDLEPDEVRDILLSTGRRVVDQDHGGEYPVLDARRALERVETPRIESFSCDTSGRPLGVVWQLVGFASTQRIRIARNGEYFLDRFLRSDVRRFDVPLADGEYSVTLEVFSAHIELGGDSATCDVIVSRGSEFRRGDCTGDGFTDISDVMALLWSIFTATEIDLCEVACDANDDDEVDVSDAVYLLDYLFRGLAPPFPPSNSCGIDPTESPLGCDVSPCGDDA